MVVAEAYTVTVKEAAERLGIQPSSVRSLIKGGMVRAVWSEEDGKYLINDLDITNYRRQKGGAVSAGLWDVRVAKGADRDGKYTHAPRLREVLVNRGMSIAAFRKAMGVSESFFYRVDKRNRNASASYRAKAAKILDTPESELFEKIDPVTP